MLQILVTIIAFVVGPTVDSERLRATAPSYLTSESAVEHLWSARVAAAAVSGEDAPILLAIAWHESRYNWRAPSATGAVSSEPGGLVSCGVMTPRPHAPPCEVRPLVLQYLDGALHLHEWRGHVRHAVLGYAGLAGACDVGPVTRVRDGRTVDLCDYERDMLARAASIGGR